MRFVKTVQKMLVRYPLTLTAPFLAKKIPKCEKKVIDPADQQFKSVILLKLVNRMKVV